MCGEGAFQVKGAICAKTTASTKFSSWFEPRSSSCGIPRKEARGTVKLLEDFFQLWDGRGSSARAWDSMCEHVQVYQRNLENETMTKSAWGQRGELNEMF